MGAQAEAHVHNSIEVSGSGTALIVEIDGDLDVASRNSTEARLFAAIDSANAVIIDLAAVTFCDSSGVAMFIALAQKAEAHGISLSMRNTPRNVRRIFEIANLDHEIELRD
jgi:anti-sigma B factor antagonist